MLWFESQTFWTNALSNRTAFSILIPRMKHNFCFPSFKGASTQGKRSTSCFLALRIDVESATQSKDEKGAHTFFPEFFYRRFISVVLPRIEKSEPHHHDYDQVQPKRKNNICNDLYVIQCSSFGPMHAGGGNSGP